MFKLGDKVKNKHHGAAGTIAEIKAVKGRDLVKLETVDPVSGERFFAWYDQNDMQLDND